MIFKKLLLIDKLLISELYRKNVQSSFWIKLVRFDILVLIISFSIIFLPWPLELLIFMIVLIPYLRLTIVKTKRLVNWKEKIDNCLFIYMNNNDYDQSARERYFKELFSIVVRYIIIVVFILIFLYNKFSYYFPALSMELRNSIELYLMIYFLSVPLFCKLSIKAKSLRKQLSVLFLTNPVILLFLIFLLIGQIPVQDPRDILFFGSGPVGSFLLIFTQAGIDKKFIVDCLIYAIIQQVLFSVIQPAYRVERGKLAVEIIAFTFGVISLVGLFVSTEISSILYKYIEKTAYLGEDYFKAIGIANPQEFKLFFETTFKYILLPSSFCSTIPLIIFKFREYSNKNKGNKLFEKISIIEDSLEKSKNLKKAIYFGGSSIKNLILVSPNFQSEHEVLISKKYKKTSRLVRRYRRIRRKIGENLYKKLNSLKLMCLKCKLGILDLKESFKEAAKIISTNWKNKRRSFCISIFFVFIIGTAIYYFLLKFYTRENIDFIKSTFLGLITIIYNEYVGWFRGNYDLANYSILTIYYGVCTLYFCIKKIRAKKVVILDKGNTIRIVVHLILFSFLFLVGLRNYYNYIFHLVLSFTIFHLLWFLSYLNDLTLEKSHQKDNKQFYKTEDKKS
ncbi:hypothetical protein [Paenibacillus durus]|uniref:Uncharacterized protein n=1 Tax=Paenibacillus durus ATCC 35681 TaxID=1333534 RepID=A0A0F7FDX5_PAEDU|nr:hypothetical protein [Paenibacillus durus]AKG37039.1 hypothetical protein VK70_23115 [Paenibacillus durus ATCC 35681]